MINYFELSDVDLIAHNYDQRQIILFGFRARGTARPDSDFDIMIVDKNNTKSIAKLYSSLSKNKITISCDFVPATSKLLSDDKDSLNDSTS